MTPVTALFLVDWAMALVAVVALLHARRSHRQADRQRRIATFWSGRAAHWEAEASEVAASRIERGPDGRFRRSA